MYGSYKAGYIFRKMIIMGASKLILPGKMSFYISALIIGAQFWEVTTEPAAMTVTALILLENFMKKDE